MKTFNQFVSESSYTFTPQSQVDEALLKAGQEVFGRMIQPMLSKVYGDVQFTFPVPSNKKAPRGWFTKLVASLTKHLGVQPKYVDEKRKEAEFVVGEKSISITKTMTGSPGGYIRDKF
ncbi:hypothetical protein VPFG_00199 [Vibrio phage nt-1]|uniref:Uncharacterized protein n=1 Tax=Vibrio phage nt-1 TaxID=115992 RepID=R9TFF5_9CAUD|nr:hypothetical protein VPFG_00199 [Vibrio phage nt-1]AGN30199.1 hypothetical protein VPFG_00199 [Vibrio phage nt-1]